MDNKKEKLPIGIVLIAHGGLAIELLNTVDYILGVKQQGVLSVSVEVCSNLDEKQQEVNVAVEKVDCGAGVILVSDLHGSTPSNLAIRASNGKNRTVIYGANLPLIIKLVKSRYMPMDKAKILALSYGRQYVNAVDYEEL